MTATPTPRSGTPILDRQLPLPPPAVPGTGLAPVLAPWIVAGIIAAAGWLLDWPPALRQGLLTDLRPWFSNQLASVGILGVTCSVVAAFYLMLAIHELGHVAAGLAVGFRFRSLRLGPLVFHRRFRVSFYRGPGALVNGVAELAPAARDRLAWRGVAMVLGGPAANLVAAWVVLLLPAPITVFTGVFVAVSIANGVNDLVPFESRLGISDGRRIWMLLRHRAQGERWLALLRLGGEINDGVLPESLSSDFLAKAIAIRDDSSDTVTAHAIGFWAAYHQHQDLEAAQRLETCLEHAGRANPDLREALMSDAAVFQARRRKRADLADAWLAAIPVTTRNTWFRSRAEAAILEATGDLDGATRKLAEVEAMILAFPNHLQRATLLELLQRWKSELSRC